MFEKLNTVVIALVGKENANTWWHSPNKAFDNKQPIDILVDNPNKVKDYLLVHLNGDYS
jgi:uncharacterized protein (DUF2384 family)